MSNFDSENFFDDFVSDLTAANLQSLGKMSIIEFANRIIFNNDPDFQLYPTQTAILKSFYNEELTEEEVNILHGWVDEERSSWIKDRKYISLILEAGRRASKAIDLNTLIATPQGYKLFKDIHPGDYVFTPEGKPTKVTAETEVFYNRKCYRLYFQNGESINCSADHEWLTSTKASIKSSGRGKSPTIHSSIKTTQEIVDSLYINRFDGNIENNHAIELTEPLSYPDQDLIAHPYCLGLWLGNDHYKSGIITSFKEDIDIVRNKFHSLGYDTQLSPSKSNAYRFKSFKLNKELEQLGIYGEEKKDKIIPNNYLISSIDQRLELLRGLMDSDGTCDKKGKAYFTSTNTNISNLVYQLALSLGCAASKTYNTGSYTNKDGKDYATISLRPNLNPFFLPRKAERYKPCTAQNNKRFIVKAELINPIPVKCITIEDSNHLFLIGEELIPTHNCNSISSVISTTLGDITYGELHQRLSNNEKIGIYTYNIKSNITKGYITYDIKSELNAVEQTYKITTETGKTEIINKNHPFLTCKKESWYPVWVELQDLQKGNYIATSSELPLFGTLEKSEDELKLWALALSVFVFTTNIDKLKEHKVFLEQYFKFSTVKQLKAELKIYRQTIKKEEITALDRNSTIIFLKHLLKNNIKRQCSTHITNAKYNRAEPFEVTIEIHKYRKQIASQFLKLGICTYRLQDSTRGIKGLVIHNTNSNEKLINIFGWDIYKGSHYLKRTFNNKKLGGIGTRFNTAVDTIENQYPPTQIANNRTLNRLYYRLFSGSKDLIGQQAIKINDVKLFDWATNNINWEKIISIEPYKVEQTVALEVKDTHVIGNGIISHNSTLASIITLKEFYDLIIEDNPQKKYGILNASPISILVMAQSQAQVKETIFSAIKGYAENSRFFTALQNNGEIEILTEEIRCKKKNVAIYAKHTNSKSLVGYTVKAMVLDEVARFESVGEDGKNKAFEIWDNVATGGSTFGSDFKKVAISSAWEPGDPIEVMYNLALKNPSSLAFKLTTFQVNLKLIKGVTEVVKSDYLNDYIKARREYEGIRFTKFNTFIEIENLNKASRSSSIIDAIPCQIDTETPSGPKHYAGLEVQRITPNQVSDSLSFIHVDPALKKDSAALAIARPIQEGDKWKIQIDALLKWEPHTDAKGNKRVVSFIDIEEKLIEISKIRRTGKITFDIWNSESIIQKLNSLGIDAQQVSCSREMQFTYYTLFRDLLAHDYIILPRDNAWTDNAITELSELVLKANKQIIHPTAGKDLADAIVNAVYQCNQYMIKSGHNLTTGLNTGIVQSQSLQPLKKITVSKFSTNNIKIGSAIDKLYKKKF